jgi:hypothetical protein
MSSGRTTPRLASSQAPEHVEGESSWHERGEGRTTQVWQLLDWQGQAPERVEGEGSEEQTKHVEQVCRGSPCCDVGT